MDGHYVRAVKFVSGEFDASPWVTMGHWGRGVMVSSPDDVSAVGRLVAAPGGDRRAVIFERVTRTRRRSLTAQIQAMGIELRPFDDTDNRLCQVEVSTIGKLQFIGALVLSAPFLIVMRLRGRRTSVFEATVADPPVESPA